MAAFDLFDLFGGGENVAGMERTAGTGASMYQMTPAILNRLLAIYQQGGRSPAFDAAARDAESSIMGQNQLQRAANARANPTNSWARIMGNMNIAKQGSQAMTNFNTGLLGQRQNLAMSALSQAGQMAQGGGGVALQGYGQAAQARLQPWQLYMDMLGQGANIGASMASGGMG